MSNGTRPIADVSLELAHVHTGTSADDETARAEIRREAFFVRSLLSALQSEDLVVSTCALIDDTGASAGSADAMRSLIDSTCREEGITIDYLVNESLCAETLTMLDPYFYPEVPPDSEGLLGTPKHVPTVDPVIANERWLENGEPGRDHPLPEPLRLPVRRSEAPDGEAQHQRAVGSRGSRMHAIHIDIELWSQQRRRGLPGPIIWSLPMLASWWQLLRLGAPTTHGGPPLAPEPASPDPPPFCAYSTLTVLPTDFLSVEHAVRTILGRVAVPDEWLAPSRTGEAAGALEHLNRISYVFAAELPTSR